MAQGTFDQPTPDFASIYNQGATPGANAGGGGVDLMAMLAQLGLSPDMLAGASDAELQALAQHMQSLQAKIGQATQSPLGAWLKDQGIVVAQPQVDANGNPVPTSLEQQLSALNVPGGGPRTPENQTKANELGAQLQYQGSQGWAGGIQQPGSPKGFAPNGQSLAYYGKDVPAFADVMADPTTGLTADMQRAIEAGTQQADGFGRTAPVGSPASPAQAQAPDARAAAIPKLAGYIANLQGVANPTKSQAQELATYQQRMAAYKAPVPQSAPVGPVALAQKAATSGGAAKPAATTALATTPPRVTIPPVVVARTASTAATKVVQPTKTTAAHQLD